MLNAPFPFYIKQLGGTELLVGITAAGYSLASLFMRPLAGWMMDNTSRSSLLIWGSLSLILISLLYLIIPVLGIVIALRIISGFLFSGAHTACTTNASDSIPQSRFGEGMGFTGLGNTLATAWGPAVGLIIIASLGFPALFAISVIILLAPALIVRGLSYKTVKHSGSSPEKTEHGFSRLINVHALPASVIMFFASIPYGGVSIFIALYGQYSGLGSGGLFFMLVALGTGSTRLFSGHLADTKGEKPMIIISCGSFLLALLMLIINSTPFYYLAGLFFGLGFGLLFPAMLAMSMRMVPMEKRGSASSTFYCFNDIGNGLGALAAGWLVTIWDYRPMFAVMIIFVILQWLTYSLWASKTPSAFKNYINTKTG